VRVLVLVVSVLLACGPAPDHPSISEGVPAVAPGACAAGQGVFHGCYYDDVDFTALVTQRDDPVIDFAWGTGAPAPGVGPDTFSVLWQGDFAFAAGTFDFAVTADDGVRLYVDDVLLVDAWRDKSATTYHATRTLGAGTHRIRVEYYENGWDAVARLSWTAAAAAGPACGDGVCSGGETCSTCAADCGVCAPPPPPSGCTTVGQGVFHGCYYDDKSLTTLAVERDDPAIDFSWGAGSPDPRVGADTFSVRWQGDFAFAGGAYDFAATADDGVRLYVDDALVVDAWRDQSATTYHATRTLAAGTHRVRLEYYENGWDAVARLSWAAVAAAGPTCGDGVCNGGETCSACAADCGACAPAASGGTVSATRPMRVLFLGNSFTSRGPIPSLVGALAQSAGWPTPDVQTRAVDGQNLGYFRADATALGLIDRGGWDFVVLQDYSTRPTDATAVGGDGAGFEADATWLYDRVKQASPGAQVRLFETWARGAAHPYYPTYYADPADMQGQLRRWYSDAAQRAIPARSTAVSRTDVRVAPVGDAWERHLGTPSPLRLHDVDDYHAGPDGQYLTALVLYGAIYECQSAGLRSLLGLSAADAARLQGDADRTTGAPACPRQTVRVDVGSQAAGWRTTAPGWNNLDDATCDGIVANALTNLVDQSGAATPISLDVTRAFGGANTAGPASNTLGYPATASEDSCWVGSGGGHAAGLSAPGELVLRHVPAGSYLLRLYGARASASGTNNDRLTRYTVAGTSLDLQASDNAGNVAEFPGVRADATGSLPIRVEVSPAGTGQYGYLNALELVRTGD
jgi:hypothetical protein